MDGEKTPRVNKQASKQGLLASMSALNVSGCEFACVRACLHV